MRRGKVRWHEDEASLTGCDDHTLALWLRIVAFLSLASSTLLPLPSPPPPPPPSHLSWVHSLRSAQLAAARLETDSLSARSRADAKSLQIARDAQSELACAQAAELEALRAEHKRLCACHDELSAAHGFVQRQLADTRAALFKQRTSLDAQLGDATAALAAARAEGAAARAAAVAAAADAAKMHELLDAAQHALDEARAQVGRACPLFRFPSRLPLPLRAPTTGPRGRAHTMSDPPLFSSSVPSQYRSCLSAGAGGCARRGAASSYRVARASRGGCGCPACGRHGGRDASSRVAAASRGGRGSGCSRGRRSGKRTRRLRSRRGGSAA